MGRELELSFMAPGAAGIQRLLDRFEAGSGIRVRPRLLTWDTAWSDLVKVALYGDGPDVSEIGSTWLGDLVVMNSLRSFSERDLAALGRPSDFLPSAWQGARLAGQPETWAIPWLAGSRLLFFRRSLLAQAGLDERTAFRTAESLHQSLGLLQASGVSIPWTVPTGLTHTTLLNVASWVWGAGGDFVTPDGKRTLFSQPSARAGIRNYFALVRFLAPSVRHLTGLEPDEQFLSSSETAVTLSGPWLFRDALARGIGPDVGMALPPGASFVGGSHLVVWKHTQQPEAALELIRFLMSPEAVVAHSQVVGLVPARLDALASPPFSTDPLWQLAITGIRTGRTIPVTRSWGLMEDRLTRELGALWSDALADPNLDLEAAIARRLEPLALRLDLVLGQH
jgi:multiple sugar transport system substrate-binding protein